MLGTYCHWRFNYQEGRCWEPIVIGDSIIKRGDVGNLLSLDIQLSRGEMLESYCHWRFNYQEGRCWEPIVIGDSIIKRGDIGILLTGLTLPHFCLYLKLETGFPMPDGMIFLVQ
jgi:hypothetical protein